MSNRLLCIGVLTVAVAMAPALAQSISDATRAATDQLTAAQAAEVDAFIELRTRQMTDESADITTVKSCRVTLIAAYSGAAGQGYMSYFATAMGSKFVPVALSPDRSPFVLVNAAIVVGAINQPEIAPSLARMLRHPNPAVRYYAAKGFAGTRDAILAQGMGEADKMLTVLAGRVGAETVPSVVRALAQALDLGSATGVDAVTLDPAQAKARQALVDLLTRHMQAIRDGNVAMSDAAGHVVSALGTMGALAPPADRTALLQAMADVMANAAKAYAEYGIQVDDRQREQIETPPAAVSMLLVYCERAIGEITGTSSSTVTRAISSTPQKTDVLSVQLKVNLLIGAGESPGTLTSAGVTAPVALPRTVPSDTEDTGGE